MGLAYRVRHEQGPQGHRYVITVAGREHATAWRGRIGPAKEDRDWMLADLGC